MGTGEEGTPSKTSKPPSSSQEIAPTPSYPDWSSSVQAYYGAGATPPPFFASTVASPTPHPYLWGGQHPLMSPYGTPLPYPAIYPPGGVYAHPNITVTPGSVPINAEYEGKSPDGKERASKKSKGMSGNTASGGGRTGESGKVASSSGNDGASQSAESGTEGSSEGSDENANQQEIAANKKGSFNQMLADGANAQNNTGGPNAKSSVTGKPIANIPGTNLNMGMDLWNTTNAASGAGKVRGNAVSSAIVSVPMVGRDGMMPEQWVQDERELKRQKRKQSNRESARRSRLRKQVGFSSSVRILSPCVTIPCRRRRYPLPLVSASPSQCSSLSTFSQSTSRTSKISKIPTAWTPSASTCSICMARVYFNRHVASLPLSSNSPLL